jgi:hypothetical protein
MPHLGMEVKMALDLQFGLFEAADSRPLWRASFADAQDAKRQAQKLANDEGEAFFVYSFKNVTEIARMFPSRGDSPLGIGLERTRATAEK